MSEIKELPGGRLSRVLRDQMTDIALAEGDTLEVDEGYVLTVRSIDIENNKIYLELTKDGQSVDSSVLEIPCLRIWGPETTYCYMSYAEDNGRLITFAIHFWGLARTQGCGYVVLADGIWQISDLTSH